MRVTRRLLAYVKPYWTTALLAVVTLTCLTALGMMTPLLTRQLIDRVIKGGEQDLLLQICLSLLGIAIARGFFRYAKGILSEKIGQSVVLDLRVYLYSHLQRLPFSYYDKARTGELMARLTGDVEGVRMFISDGILNFYDCLLTFTMVTFILFRMNVTLTLLCLSFAPFLGWTVMRFDRQIRPAYTRIREQMASMSSVLQENVTGVRVVKAFAREEHETDKFVVENTSLRQRVVDSADISAKYLPFMDLLGNISSTVVIWYGGYQVISGNLSLGQLVAFNAYIWSLIWPMRSLGHLVNLMEQAVAAGQRLFEILDVQPEIATPPGAYSEPVTGRVEFRDVSFHYGQEEVLRGIDLVVEPGTTVAIVGSTGSGKSTLVNLIGRFYDVTSGQVLVDGVDVRDWNLDTLRRSIGIALQETFLFSASLRDNISYGREKVDDDEVAAAARIAQAEPFISELADRYETMVGERGMGLSGGQRQRIAIARALLVDPKILVLDDSTSSVDMETEYIIQTALREKRQGRTTFIIAHRISTLQSADEIVVLEQGRIAERGTHRDLLEIKGGIYRGIYDAQIQDQETLSKVMVRRTGTEGGQG